MRCSRTLSLQDLEVVAVKSRFADGVSLRQSSGDLIAKRAFGGSVRGLPVEAILLSRCAHDLLRILVHSRTIADFRCVLHLGIDVNVANLDCVQFIGADSPKEDFLPPCLGVEVPFAVLFHDRRGNRPLLFTHDDGRAVAVRINLHRMLDLSFLGKRQSIVLVLHRIR